MHACIYIHQVCISFALHCGTIVIPKTVNPVRLVENFKGTEVTLDDEDMSRIRAIDKKCRLFMVCLSKGSCILANLMV